MTSQTGRAGNFVPVSALDKRVPTKRELLRGLARQAPFVGKNFLLYFKNVWRRRVLRTKVVAPYAVTFYVTHKCNLLLHTERAGRFQRGIADGFDDWAAAAHSERDGLDCDYGRGAVAAGGH
jgi:hypothetical protein